MFWKGHVGACLINDENFLLHITDSESMFADTKQIRLWGRLFAKGLQVIKSVFFLSELLTNVWGCFDIQCCKGNNTSIQTIDVAQWDASYEH